MTSSGYLIIFSLLLNFLYAYKVLLSPPFIILRFFIFIALHNDLGLARYLNHLYDSDMSLILYPKARPSQALKTLRLNWAILVGLSYEVHA